MIPPPVDVAYFTPPDGAAPRGEFALAAGRMVGYKRLDLAVRACALVGYPLVVAGAGPEERRLRELAAGLGAKVEFVVGPGDATLRELYRTANVLGFPGEEDFGIVPVEAQACGTPVLAPGKGGVLDTVVPGVTGVLVAEQDEHALADGLRAILDRPLDPAACRQNAARFGIARFQDEVRAWVGEAARARGVALDLVP